jgi:prepilin-type processing-associated H-X9-DG protein
MLLPSLNQAKAKAKAIACTNNFKQCGVTTLLYADDYDGMPTIKPNNRCEGWREKVFDYHYSDIREDVTRREPYAKPNSHLLTCPADVAPYVIGIAYSYAANLSLTSTDPSATADFTPRRFAALKNTSQDWLAFDGWYSDATINASGFIGESYAYLGDYGAYWRNKRISSAGYGRFIAHGKRFNVLFCDGHVWSSPGYPWLEGEIGTSKADRPNAYWAEF